jgi:hypothetical protein
LSFNNNWLNVLYAVSLAAVSIFTQEIVTFIMLGFIFRALLSINSTLLKILTRMENVGIRSIDNKQ